MNPVYHIICLLSILCTQSYSQCSNFFLFEFGGSPFEITNELYLSPEKYTNIHSYSYTATFAYIDRKEQPTIQIISFIYKKHPCFEKDVKCLLKFENGLYDIEYSILYEKDQLKECLKSYNKIIQEVSLAQNKENEFDAKKTLHVLGEDKKVVGEETCLYKKSDLENKSILSVSYLHKYDSSSQIDGFEVELITYDFRHTKKIDIRGY